MRDQSPQPTSAATTEAQDGGPHLLHVVGLSFAYPGRPGLLHDLHLTLQPRERVGVIGPNGAGKTTLFMLLCGVLTPDAGTIQLLDRPIQPGAFHPEIGMVFQNPDDQLFCLSVWDDVAFGPQNLGLPRTEVAARVEAALTTTGVRHLAERSPQHLSGGEQRMVAIAGVLALHPRLIIYDEPSANLDIRSRRRLIQFLQASPQTLLLASHDLELILEVCNRVLLLDAGQIVVDGRPRAVMGDAALMAAHGLECPAALARTE
jgi:cobalt/nickel transport system ATP-binding protein